MTDVEQRAIRSLMDVQVSPRRNDWMKITRLYVTLSSDERWPLSSSEQSLLWPLVWRYRRQIADAEVVAAAGEAVNGEMALRF